MDGGTAPKGSLLWLCLSVLVLLTGLCTIFALVVTVAEAWQEHAQTRWPEAIAHVERCGMVQTSTGRRNNYYIRCRLIYAVGDEQNVATIYSRNVPSTEVWQYPRNQIAPYEKWVGEHPPGTPIVVRYDPDNHSKIARLNIDMPSAGPRTPSNIKLLEVCAGSFLVLLAIAQITRPRALRQNEYPSMPSSL
jgi:Protein of unknown function (DUF3592)